MENEKVAIYKIYNENNCYVGSTIQSLNRRLNHHKCYDYCKSRTIIKEGNYKIELICEVAIEDRLKEEQLYIDMYSTLNQNKAYVEDRVKYKKDYNALHKEENSQYQYEYREIKKDEISKQRKEFYEKNKEALHEKANSKIKCECGCLSSYANLPRHRKSKKHLKYLEETK